MKDAKANRGAGDAAVRTNDLDGLIVRSNNRPAELNQAPQVDPNEVDPLDLLFERVCVLADRVRSGELLLIDAVDFAYSAADFAGMVNRYGDDEVQRVLAAAFMGARPAKGAAL